MPHILRNVSKYDFKRKIKRVLFNILYSEDSYLDIRNVIQKVKFSKVLMYSQNNNYSLNCIIVVFFWSIFVSIPALFS